MPGTIQISRAHVSPQGKAFLTCPAGGSSPPRARPEGEPKVFYLASLSLLPYVLAGAPPPTHRVLPQFLPAFLLLSLFEVLSMRSRVSIVSGLPPLDIRSFASRPCPSLMPSLDVASPRPGCHLIIALTTFAHPWLGALGGLSHPDSPLVLLERGAPPSRGCPIDVMGRWVDFCRGSHPKALAQEQPEGFLVLGHPGQRLGPWAGSWLPRSCVKSAGRECPGQSKPLLSSGSSFKNDRSMCLLSDLHYKLIMNQKAKIGKMRPSGA